MNPMKLAAAAAIAAGLICYGRADLPRLMNYQGRLLDNTGMPLSTNVTITVGMYTNAMGGAAEYLETIGSVTVKNGLYAFHFGGDTQTLMTALSGKASWLEVVVNGLPLVPRQRLVAVPYAILSDRVQQVGTNTTFAPGSVPGEALTDGAVTSGKLAADAYTETDPVYRGTPAAAIIDSGSGAVISGAERNKLAVIEAGADITDTANVKAAGAVMVGDIGVTVQAFNTHLADLADGILGKSRVQDSTNWDAAYAWGNHDTNGYLTVYIEADPVAATSVWDNAQYANAVLLDGSRFMSGELRVDNNVIVASNLYVFGIISNATYFGDGAGLTNVTAVSYAETDPRWAAVSNAVSAQAAHGETAYAWGNHATNAYADQTYVDSATGTLHAAVAAELDADVAALSNALDSVAFDGETDPRWAAVSNAVSAQAAHGETAYAWGNHATNAYLSSYTETDPVWSGVSNQYLRSTTAAATYVSLSGGAMSGALSLPIGGLSVDTTQLVVLASGNVGIGISNPTNRLCVNGTIHAREVIVDLVGWPDYVFEDGYDLMPLEQVNAYIERNGHLPGVPSAEEVGKGGVRLGDMQARLLQKVEELTLHMVALQQENMALQRRVEELESR